MKRNLLFLCSIIAFSGCVIVNFTDPSAVAPRGKPETFDIATGDFSGIKVEGYCDIHYSYGQYSAVSLTLQPNVRPLYAVDVVNGDLVIRTTKRINFRHADIPVLTVASPELNRLVIEGACNFTANDTIAADSMIFVVSGAGSVKADLDVRSLSVNIAGSGEFKFSGKARTADLKLSGMGDLDALPLETSEAMVNLSGAGTVRVSCSDNISVNASGTGSVVYRGTPHLDLNTNGMVNVRRLD